MSLMFLENAYCTAVYAFCVPFSHKLEQKIKLKGWLPLLTLFSSNGPLCKLLSQYMIRKAIGDRENHLMLVFTQADTAQNEFYY